MTADATLTFPTTYMTKTVNTIQIDPSALATSNGHSGMGSRKGTTSAGHVNGAIADLAVPGLFTLLAAAAAGTWIVTGRA